MIEKCWSKDPKERPTFNELFKKLSLENEDFLLEFEESYEEPKITDNDEEEEEETELNMKYCLDGVDIGEVLDYVYEIKEETSAADQEKEELREQIEQMKAQISSLKKITEEDSKQMQNMNKIIKEQANEISSLKVELLSLKRLKDKSIVDAVRSHTSQISSIQQKMGSFMSPEMSLTGQGILSLLKEKQKNPFDKFFVTSLSSADIYTLLTPDSDGDFGTSNTGNFFIDFQLESEVTINGIKIFSSDIDFPKSFDFAVDDRTVASVKEATELNGKFKVMTVNFSPIKGSKIRFTQTGPNWDKDTNFLYIKGFELLSTEAKYSRGVFETLVDEAEDKDPHKCPVLISAQNFDFNKYHLIDSHRIICTSDKENSWFQVELTRGTAVLNGFRINRSESCKLKSYKVICTDDKNKPEESWTTLIEINESDENEHQLLDIYQFPHPSPPTRIVRIVQTEPSWSDGLKLKFFHFDMFGYYF